MERKMSFACKKDMYAKIGAKLHYPYFVSFLQNSHKGGKRYQENLEKVPLG